MISLINRIFGSVQYDDRSDAYYWHPWLEDDDVNWYMGDEDVDEIVDE